MTCQRAVIFHSISIKRLSQCQIYKFSDTLRPWIFVDAKNSAWNVPELLGKASFEHSLVYSNSTRTWENWSKIIVHVASFGTSPQSSTQSQEFVCVRYVYPLAATNLYFPHRTRSLEGLCVLLVESSEASLD